MSQITTYHIIDLSRDYKIVGSSVRQLEFHNVLIMKRWFYNTADATFPL